MPRRKKQQEREVLAEEKVPSPNSHDVSPSAEAEGPASPDDIRAEASPLSTDDAPSPSPPPEEVLQAADATTSEEEAPKRRRGRRRRRRKEEEKVADAQEEPKEAASSSTGPSEGSETPMEDVEPSKVPGEAEPPVETQRVVEPSPVSESQPERPAPSPLFGTPQAKAPSPWTAALFSSLLAFLFAVVVTLGVLSTLNRGLIYARPADVGRLASRVQTLEERLVQMEARLGQMEQQVRALSDLGARVESLEAETEALREEVTAAREDLQTLNAEVDTLAERQGRVISFFEQLRDLLDTFFGTGPTPPSTEGPSGSEPTPEVTP